MENYLGIVGNTGNQGLLMGLIYLASGHSTKTVGGDSSLEASTHAKEGATGVKNWGAHLPTLIRLNHWSKTVLSTLWRLKLPCRINRLGLGISVFEVCIPLINMVYFSNYL